MFFCLLARINSSSVFGRRVLFLAAKTGTPFHFFLPKVEWGAIFGPFRFWHDYCWGTVLWPPMAPYGQCHLPVLLWHSPMAPYGPLGNATYQYCWGTPLWASGQCHCWGTPLWPPMGNATYQYCWGTVLQGAQT